MRIARMTHMAAIVPIITIASVPSATSATITPRPIAQKKLLCVFFCPRFLPQKNPLYSANGERGVL